jgi:biopolymer transport protein ExbB
MLELIIHGGWAMWVIVGCSIVGLAIIFERWRTLSKADVDTEQLLDNVSRALEKNNVDEAIQICESTAGPVAETLGIGLRKMLFLERIGKKPEEIEEGIVAAMEEHGSHVLSFLERNLNTLATVSSMAPILGMMGTVIGMIKSFGGVALAGNMTPGAVAKGISEALICTASGLIVAAFTTVFYNYFVNRVNRFVLQVQSAATALMEKVLHARSLQAPKPAAARPAAAPAGAARPAAAAPAARPAPAIAPPTA